MDHRNRGLIAASAATFLALCPGAYGQDEASGAYDLPAQDLRRAVRAVARKAGFQLVAAPGLLRARTAPPLKGAFSAQQALDALLANTGLVAHISGGTILIRGRDTSSRAPGAAVGDIVVTGTRLRGEESASKVTALGREAMKSAGLGTLAEAMQTIPQNFGGGQNPGVGLNVPESTGVAHGSASSINLRGLGSDATLTLLNGHRLAYNFAFQAIDISALPFEAIDRIEIVADGSSALYGSDAVAGVANILLRRDYDGVKASARLGGSTDGGNVQQQYGLLGGQRWSSGGLLLAGEYGRTTPILAAQRAYSARRAPGLYLSPSITRHSLLLSGHQALGQRLSLSLDALYNKRESYSQYAYDARGDIEAYGSTSVYGSKSFVVAPSLALDLGRDWRASLAGMIGSDRTRYAYHILLSGQPIFEQVGCYCNKARSLELGADGTLLDLPGGAAKLAVGGGYRINRFHGYRDNGSQNIRAAQDVWFAYGELGLPLVGPAKALPFIERLSLSAALRYEDYPGVDKVATPKLGIIYAPASGIDLKASWGKSFRAPTLYQQFNQSFVNIYNVATLGGSGYPAGATAMLVTGGNPALKPERATSWSATLDLHPASIEGLRIEASYFDVRYRDRIVTPIQYSTQSLRNPLYAEFVDTTPSAAEIGAAIARADVFTNVAGGVFDPARIVAIVNNFNVNAARQTLKGVDLSVRYTVPVQDQGQLGLSAEASYLDSAQTTSLLQPAMQRSGTLFNPPKLRARGGINWAAKSLSLSVFANHVGKLRDVRQTSPVRIGATTSFDASLRFSPTRAQGPLQGLDVVLAVQNLFDKKPPLISTTNVWEAPYDSTNYGAVGRFIALSIAKSL